jgi:methionyl-tRNA synthetase
VTKGGRPRQGFENKVFYVWFDAPIEYIAATAEWAEANDGDWTSWWRIDQGAGGVRYVQFIGKDNVAFHTVSFPATLLGSGEPWKTVDVLKSFNWLTWYGGKFSTSQKRGVFMDAALELLPADYWRWYLIANAPEGSDAPFTWEHFAATVNSDLANVLGNFVNRILRFTESRFAGVVPGGREDGPLEATLRSHLKSAVATLTKELERMNMRAAAKTA